MAASVEIIPTAVGNKWEYESVKLTRATIEYKGRMVAKMNDTSSGACIYEVLSVDNTKGEPVYDYVESTSMRSTGTGSLSSDKSELMITNGPDGLKILSIENDSSDGKTPVKQRYDPPLMYFSNDAIAGKTWEVGTMRDGEVTNLMTAKGVGRETVTVPAGTFKDCLKVIYISDDISGSMEIMGQKFTFTSGKSRGIYWIADGVGVVKELEVSTSTSQAPGPGGGFVTMEGATATVTELKPGYVIKK
ncbi:MAG: hypothetical protein M1133_00880 [Armatimonadetes bacterium]|nr:hypothetical protein [Armatimonadota bacterium]